MFVWVNSWNVVKLNDIATFYKGKGIFKNNILMPATIETAIDLATASCLLKEQKKALMQKLLTGEIRVKMQLIIFL